LNNREKLRLLEDSKGNMTISNLAEREARNVDELIDIIN